MSKNHLTSITEIERIEAPTRQEFEENYVQRRRPVILTGVLTRTKAFREWTPEYLKEVAGDAVVTVHYDERGNFGDWYGSLPTEREDRKIPLGQLLDLLLAEPPDLRYYMTEHNLGEISEALCEDISMSDYIDDVLAPGRSSGPCMFIGRDICMPIHYHPTTEAFMCQLSGAKVMTLYGPEQFPYLYPRPWYKPNYIFTQLDWATQRAMAKHDRAGMDLQRYPKLAHARGVEFTVHPGEILFIPVHWWHVTSVEGFQTSMTYFWRSDPSRWHYPSPGLQVRAREAMRVSTQGLKKLKARLTGRPVVPA